MGSKSRSIDYRVPPQNLQVPDLWNLIFVSGPISEMTAVDVCSKLLSIDLANKTNDGREPVTLLINSPGGDLNAAWQICDIMDFIETPVHTVGLGQICSAALIILMNGERGFRKTTDRTAIMSHVYSWGNEGNHNQLIAQTQEYNNIMGRMIKHYEETTGLSEKEIKEFLLTGTDTWLTSKQAKKFNLIDEVVVSNKTKRIKKNTVKKKVNDNEQE